MCFEKITLLLATAILATCLESVKVMAIQIENEENIEESYDYTQEPIGYNDENWSYVYETQEYGYEMLMGAYFMGEYYSYLYNESDMIVGMCNAEGIQVVKYDYDEHGTVSETMSFENDRWEKNSSIDFIGNKNKMLSAGMFYDENTNCYYVNNRYFNPVLNKYMDGVDGIDLYVTENPYYQTNEDGISMIAAEDSDEAATEWAEECLASSTFGVPITNYSTSWYAGLSDVEILARAIFCEGGTAYTEEGSAVAWVIRNRVESTKFAQNTAIEVVKAANQFSSITGSTAAVTREARIPSTETDRWKHATYLACFLLTTNSKTEWRTVIGNKLNGQLYFYAFTTAKNKYQVGTCPFSGTSESTLKYHTSAIENVYVQGYGDVTSFNKLFADYSPIESSRNIFYDYK